MGDGAQVIVAPVLPLVSRTLGVASGEIVTVNVEVIARPPISST